MGKSVDLLLYLGERGATSNRSHHMVSWNEEIDLLYYSKERKEINASFLLHFAAPFLQATRRRWCNLRLTGNA